MTETGRVREVREKTVIVAPDRGAECFGCMASDCRNGAGLITAENPEGLPLETGQTVEVVTVNASLLSQALVALLPPILGFVLGFNLSRLVFPFPTAPDGASAGMGVIFLFAAAFVVYLIRKKHPANQAYKITKIIT